MARMIPNEPVGTVSPEIAKLFQVIKRLPGDDYIAWMSLPSARDDSKPEFLVSYLGKSCFLISVASVSQQLADSAIEPNFLATLGQATMQVEDVGRAESEVLRRFEKEVIKELAQTIVLQKLVVFPNVTEDVIEQVVLRQAPSGVRYLGRERLTSENLTEALKSMAEPVTEKTLYRLRLKFTPEARVPASFSPLRKIERRLEPELTDFLMDIDQEGCVKQDLKLPEEAERLVEDLKARLVTGVAGSGKSLVLIYRALLLARLHENARCLVLTHNRPLRGELQRRFHRLGGGAAVEWKTFFAWIYGLWQGDWLEPMGQGQREALTKELRDQQGIALQSLSIAFLLEEIDWLKDAGVVNLADYLEMERRGRGVRLGQAMRKVVFRLYAAYQQVLQERGLIDWSGVALRFWKDVEAQRVTLPQYDFVFVDEAQFFAPVWFRSIRQCLNPETGQLFLAADPTQGFLKRRSSWLASGIDVRGRTTRLRRSYRNTAGVLAFASAFYRDRLGDEEDEDIHLVDAISIKEAPDGPPPEILCLTSAQDEITRVINEVKSLTVDHGVAGEHLLILHAESMAIDTLQTALGTALGEKNVADLRRQVSPGKNAVRVCSLNAGTGLESPVVFLLGIDTLLQSEAALGLTEEEREERVRDNTRRLYMAFTRAGQRLVVTCRSERTALWLGSLLSSTDE